MRRLLLSIGLSLLITNTAFVAAQSDDPAAGRAEHIYMKSATDKPQSKIEAELHTQGTKPREASQEKSEPVAPDEKEEGVPVKAETETAPMSVIDAHPGAPSRPALLSSGDEGGSTVEPHATSDAESEPAAMPTAEGSNPAESQDKPPESLKGESAPSPSSTSELENMPAADEQDTTTSGPPQTGLVPAGESGGATTSDAADGTGQVVETNSEPVEVDTERPDSTVINQIAELKSRSERAETSDVDSVATEAESLGAKLSAQSLPEEAAQCYEMAYQARARIVDKEDPSLLPSIFGQANCQFHSTNYDNSTKWFEQALTISEKLSPQKEEDKYDAMSRSLMGLAGCYLIQGDGQSAYPHCQRMYEMTRTRYGAGSTEVFWSAAQLGECCRVRGMKEGLEKFLNEMFEICLERAGGKEQIAGTKTAMAQSPHDDLEQSSANKPGAQSPAVLPFRFWSPSERPARAILICVHGMCLHAGSYEEFARDMRQRGFLVVGLDVRGFGSWMGSQSQDYLNLSGCLADIHYMVGKFNQMLPGVPIFLLGESMGGGIVLHAASNDSDNIAGIITSVPAGQRFAQKSQALSVAIHLPFGIHHNMNIGKSLLKRATQNDLVRLKWQSDNLARMLVSPRELIGFQHFMDENPKFAQAISNKPVLVVQGMQDHLVKPQATIRLFEKIHSRDKTLLLRKDGEHLAFELGQYSPDVVNQLTTWIDRHSVKRETNQSGQI